MKEKNMTNTGRRRKLSIQAIQKSDQVNSDQVVDHENAEKIRKLRMKKVPKNPVIEQADSIEQEKSAHIDGNQGSHSLSALHFFQNQHR